LATVVVTPVPHASKAGADRFDKASRDDADGRSARGLMAHLAYPSGEGFVICNVWRTEADMRPFYDRVVLPKLAEAGS
jgi:hypothetical protein